MADELPNAQIPELPPLPGLPSGALIPVWDPVQGLTGHLDLSLYLPSGTHFPWVSFNPPGYMIDDLVTHEGKLWQSLQDNNLGNEPEEGVWWTEISQSFSGGFAPWTAGEYTPNIVFVMSDHTGNMGIYQLVAPARPYNSVDIAAEETAGDWKLVEDRFTADILVSLSGGKTFGKYSNGQTIPATGKTPKEVILDAAIEYLAPAFTSFEIAAQPVVVELGTTIPAGVKNFLWGTSNGGNVNAGVPNSIKITDETTPGTIADTLLNDGNQGIAFGPKLLVNEGDTQVFKIWGLNTLAAAFTRLFTITADYLRFYGTPAVAPANSAQVRALGNSTFSNVFNLFIPQGQTIISFAYEATRPDIVDSSVKYVEGFNSNVGATFVKSEFSVNDANGTPRAYKIYTATLGAPFPANATYAVTIP